MDLDTGDSLVVTGVSTGGNPGELFDLVFGTYGSLFLADTGDWSYYLNSAGTDALAQGASVDDVFGYTIADISGAAASGTLTIHFADASDFIL
jgi:VCBS repeat-containing protein